MIQTTYNKCAGLYPLKCVEFTCAQPYETQMCKTSFLDLGSCSHTTKFLSNTAFARTFPGFALFRSFPRLEWPI